jgi:hypothetical protein
LIGVVHATFAAAQCMLHSVLALLLLAKLTKAMGRAIVREARPVMGPALRCLCDSKPFVSAVFWNLLYVSCCCICYLLLLSYACWCM